MNLLASSGSDNGDVKYVTVDDKKKRRMASSGSDDGDAKYLMADDKKKRRMISNRESARRSRVRKQQHLETLVNQLSKLQVENSQLNQKINDTSQKHIEVASENNVLRAQAMELTERLRSANSVLQIVEEVSGFAMDIPEIPESLAEPWKVSFPVQPIMATTSSFPC